MRAGRASEIISPHPTSYTEEEEGLDHGHTGAGVGGGQGQTDPDSGLLPPASLLLPCHPSLPTLQLFLIFAFLPLFHLYLA